MLRGKKILLGVCGSIAAYKTAFLVRLLVKAGAEVRVVMTDAATTFITPLTLSTLSKSPVYKDFSDSSGNWNNHVELGIWADVFLIAPASANTMAHMATGACDNLLTAVYLSAKCPVMVAPAMDLDMWKHPSTQANVTKLRSYGNHIISVEHGELASGLVGEGRMTEPEELVKQLESHFSGQKKSPESDSLTGKKVIITAGPTVEPIDPVRFISNHSSGKMGIALAEELASRGAEVTLVKGPTIAKVASVNIKVVEVKTAQEMFDAATKDFPESDIGIMSAAVADYTPEAPADRKIKKNGSDMTLKLVKTQDILAQLGKMKTDRQLLVGFALETNNERENAEHKLKSKNLDLIVLNSLRDEGAGFGHDTNKVTILDREGNATEYGLKDKTAVAVDIADLISQKLMVHA